MSTHRHIYFGKILSDLGSHAVHGHFENAKDYSEGTGVFTEEGRPHHLFFAITILRFRFHYNTNTGQYVFYEMEGRRQGPPIVEGWDGLTMAQQQAFIGELFGFYRINRLVDRDCDIHDYIDDLCIPPAGAS